MKLMLSRHGANDVRSEKQTLVQVVRLALLVALGVALVGCWLRPWQYAEGNPDLSGVPTATASARVVDGCRVGDSLSRASSASARRCSSCPVAGLHPPRLD